MRIVIVEDEPVVAARIQRMVAEIQPRARQASYASLDQALQALDTQPADTLLLDLNLRGQDGFELLAEVVATPAETIVISANIHRAIEAFEWGVVDFVPKPFNRQRLELAFQRLHQPRRDTPATRLAVRHAGKLEVIGAERIVAIHGAGNYTELELEGGDTRLHEKSLDSLERTLPEHFLRVHRSHILNVRAIQRLRNLPGSRYRAEMVGGSQWPVSRKRIRVLRAAIEGDG